VRRKVLSRYQGVKDGRHQEVGDATACVAQPSGKRIGCADDILVEETRRPDLARHETTTEDPNKEAEGKETRSVVNGTSKNGGEGTGQKAARKSESRTEAIAGWPG